MKALVGLLWRPAQVALIVLCLNASQSSAQGVDVKDVMEQAEAGDAQAQYKLAVLYHEGRDVTQNYAQAAFWALAAAEQGDAQAQNLMGRYAYGGLGVEQDQTLAIHWLRTAADQNGDPDFLFDLAVALENGVDGSHDFEGAAEVYAAAAAQGHENANVSLGVMLQDGRGVPQDFNKARAVYETAAENGNARAQNNLGLMYARGEGVEQNYELAAQLFTSAAEQNLQQAIRNLGVMYENGFGVPLDEAYAAELYRVAGGGGDTPIQTTGPEFVYDDRLAPPSQDVATLNRLALVGDPIAQFQLGWLLLSKVQPEHADKVEAAKLFRAAAEAGHVPAMINLGIMYFRGAGVAQDYMLGQMWLTIAAGTGQQAAQDALAFFGNLPTTDQVNEAQALAAEKRTQP